MRQKVKGTSCRFLNRGLRMGFGENWAGLVNGEHLRRKHLSPGPWFQGHCGNLAVPLALLITSPLLTVDLGEPGLFGHQERSWFQGNGSVTQGRSRFQGNGFLFKHPRGSTHVDWSGIDPSFFLSPTLFFSSAGNIHKVEWRII